MQDFLIEYRREVPGVINLVGIESPGLTSALPIARRVASILREHETLVPNSHFNPVRHGIIRFHEASRQEQARLIAENPDYGEIVCRCEQISRGEVIDALHRSVPCDTLDGVRRRVRPGGGRCQGGFCGPLVLQLIAQETKEPLEAVGKSGPGGEVLFGSIKEVLPQ